MVELKTVRPVTIISGRLVLEVVSIAVVVVSAIFSVVVVVGLEVAVVVAVVVFGVVLVEAVTVCVLKGVDDAVVIFGVVKEVSKVLALFEVRLAETFVLLE